MIEEGEQICRAAPHLQGRGGGDLSQPCGHLHLQSPCMSCCAAQCTLHTAQCTLQTAQCTLHTTQCTVHTTHCTVHTTHYTLHSAHYTLHSAHYTLQSVHYTVLCLLVCLSSHSPLDNKEHLCSQITLSVTLHCLSGRRCILHVGSG